MERSELVVFDHLNIGIGSVCGCVCFEYLNIYWLCLYLIIWLLYFVASNMCQSKHFS
jgi:hypothetical protein